ncbi:hypothetical protein HMPREF0971_02029 [Segatella oris F0302]|uniref:Uncharacterized protein n=1 Tax=Segatella oris F0302 TaxID=649760 RepID=D1QSR8_9BACT|nr:hypothetical protein HMPREF0971_02029 [Segatella oris F0302]
MFSKLFFKKTASYNPTILQIIFLFQKTTSYNYLYIIYLYLFIKVYIFIGNVVGL